MTVVTCGRTNLSDRAEHITRVLREAQGFCLDVGCGRTHDLDNPIQHMQVARCLECLRWMCRPCLAAHFEESADSPRQDDGRATAPAIPSAESGEQSERTTRAQTPSAPDQRHPHPFRIAGGDDRLVGPNADAICERAGAGDVQRQGNTPRPDSQNMTRP